MLSKISIVFGTIGVLCLLVAMVWVSFGPSRFQDVESVIVDVADNAELTTAITQNLQADLALLENGQVIDATGHLASFENTSVAVSQMCEAFKYALHQSRVDIDRKGEIDINIHGCQLLVEHEAVTLNISQSQGITYIKEPGDVQGLGIEESMKFFHGQYTAGIVASEVRGGPGSGAWSFHTFVNGDPNTVLLLYVNAPSTNRPYISLLEPIFNIRIDHVMRDFSSDTASLETISTESLTDDCQMIAAKLNAVRPRAEIKCKLVYQSSHTEIHDSFDDQDQIGRMLIQRRGMSESSWGGSKYTILIGTNPILLLQVDFQRGVFHCGSPTSPASCLE